ncbi:MAG: NADH-quinone oxidoreductase subunit NuoG [bacterium]
MSDQESIKIEVDGQSLEAKPGQMLIDVTDAAGISVPRFCYHKKLSIAANCRMCLVEVENAPKPLPACATPVMDGMKVFTRSPLAREAQKGTMEFLLINHPLDCPICDQGGECELQDVAMGYGGDVSRFSERKRVVKDENIGSLISTDMTRCIHCTRCVRFGTEIAGVREMGATGRGEHTRIGVYVEQAVASELSGNVIDLCPVGALTSKPFRFNARAWEMQQLDSIAPHDTVGSNVHVHVRRNKILRVVPRDNEAINETWISDRDRFAYEGLYTADRLERPMIRQNGTLREVGWQEALQTAAKMLKATSAERLGTLVSPNATLEEMYLAQKLTRGLGSGNVDHRLRQADFRAPEADPAVPWLGQPLAALENNDATLLVGSWLRKEQPLVNTRVKKSTEKGGVVMAINPVDYEFNYDLLASQIVAPAAMVSALAGIASALGADTCGLSVSANDVQQQIAEQLKSAEKGSVLLGNTALMHPDFSLIRALANNIASAAGITIGFLGEGANSVAAWSVGAVPHRAAAGAASSGKNVAEMIADGLDTCLAINVEPEFDSSNPQAAKSALAASNLIAMTTHTSPWLMEHADVLLPMGAFGETAGTLINCQGDQQSFRGVVEPAGEARPGWKILRVLGNLIDVDDMDYLSADEVREAATENMPALDNTMAAATLAATLVKGDQLQRIGGVPMYSIDNLVRRAHALQHTPDAWKSGIRMRSSVITQLALNEGESAVLKQGEDSVILPVIVDERVPDNCVWMPTGVPGSDLLGAGFDAVSVEKA